MDRHAFENRLKILRGIDMHELRDGGFPLEPSQFRRFRDDPYAWMLRLDDESAEKLWRVVEGRADIGDRPIVEHVVRAGYGPLSLESSHESEAEAEAVYDERRAEPHCDGIELRRVESTILRTHGAPPPPLNVVSLPKRVV